LAEQIAESALVLRHEPAHSALLRHARSVSPRSLAPADDHRWERRRSLRGDRV